MAKAPTFNYVPEASGDNMENCPIQITSGQFKGIVYRYGKISLAELDDGGLNVTMDIKVIYAPENFDQSNKDFTVAVGEIFTQIVESGIEQEPVDLEDDVHQDQ